jgi:uncharacterized membrane protein YbhN (UPF0104 family)
MVLTIKLETYTIKPEAMYKKTNRTHFGPRQIIGLVLLSIFIFIVITQIHTLVSSIGMLKHALPIPIAGAISCIAITYLLAASTYYFLTTTRLPYLRTVIVQLAAMFINRLVPSGIGAVGANFAYLKRQKFSTTQALTIVSINNILGLVGHATLIVIALVLFSSQLPPIHLPSFPRVYSTVLLIILGVVLATFIARRRVRMRLVELLKTVRDQLLLYARKPQYFAFAYISSAGLTTANVGALYLCILALGVHVPFVVVLLAFTFGVGAGAALPTPGGLGGVEAGIVGALVAYGVPITQAVSAVVAYRLISYWLPLIGGGLALLYVQRKHYLG